MSQTPPIFPDFSGTTHRVLVVCTGNICRSPAAEIMLREHAVFGGSTIIESAGLGAVVGAPIDPPMREVLDRMSSWDTQRHRARQITPEMISSADLVITMSTKQRSEVLAKDPQAIGKVFTLIELGHLVRIHGPRKPLADLHTLRGQLPMTHALDIADPYRRGDGAMQISALEITRAVSMLAGVPLAHDALMAAGEKPLTVMTSARPIDDRTGIYTVSLTHAMAKQPLVDYQPFSWRTAITRKIDVFHSHWPEAKLTSPSTIKRWGRRFAFWLMLANFKRNKTAVVQTMHNLKPHEARPAVDVRLLDRLQKQEALRISINATTPHDGATPIETILHGHGRSWFGQFDQSQPTVGKLAYFGLIRDYKGVVDLLSVFTRVTAPLTLSVAGNPAPQSLGEELRELAQTDSRIDLQLGHIPDADLVHLITSSTLIVLPYREMHNSGAAITALSLNRPVLVPSNESTDALAAEVGEDWVIRYDSELTPEVIVDAIERATRAIAGGAPDLSLRDWDLAGEQHTAVFAESKLRAERGLIRGAKKP